MPTTIPTTTSTDRASLSPSAGDAYFETDTKSYIIYDGTNWRVYASDGLAGWSGSNTYSMNFDGLNDTLIPNVQINVSGAKSLTIWFKASAFNNRSILGSSVGYLYWFHFGSSSTLSAINGQTVNYTSWNSNDWFHLAATSSGPGNNLHIYVNGNPVNTNLADYDFTFNRIGSNNAGNNYFFQGLIDEMGVWNTQLTGSEIAEIYGSPGNRAFDLTANSGNYSSASSLQHYYRMGDNDSGSSSTVTDNAGSNNLTINGATSSNTTPI